MQRKHVPATGLRYWTALTIVSIFGANLGDFSAHDLELGHVLGLLPMAVLLAVVFLAERRDRSWNQAYYWLAIIIVRAAATNLGDFCSHNLGKGGAVVFLIALLVISLAFWPPAPSVPNDAAAEHYALPVTDARYWTAMLIAGTVGTVIGDIASFGLHLGTATATLVLGTILALVFYGGSRGLFAISAYYWLAVVAVRSAGTSAGDFLAGRAMIGLPLSTLCTGLVFTVVVLAWKDETSRRLRLAEQPS
ncbi:MAG TPA: hypothetical protein VN766_11770 [Stellaceae bacterium]|nr:hypothetical protein [Stellaceae bacterium]